MKTIGIIGCGNMGEAILAQSLKRKGKSFVIFDKDKSKQNRLARLYRVPSANDITDLMRKSDILIIAVKPQDIDILLEVASKSILLCGKTDILIISIAAGINTEYIENTISGRVRVIRAMPNMPARIGKGITALTKGRFAADKDYKAAQDIFKSLGQVLLILREDLIDVVTALSGSGPAYIFFILSAFLAAAEELGLDKNSASKLIYHTVIGSADLLKASKFKAEDLISQVASPGGTTEAALNIFNERKIKKIIREAIIAAYKRAGELSR